MNTGIMKRLSARLGYTFFDILSIIISLLTLAYANPGTIYFTIGSITSGYLLICKYVLILNKGR